MSSNDSQQPTRRVIEIPAGYRLAYYVVTAMDEDRTMMDEHGLEESNRIVLKQENQRSLPLTTLRFQLHSPSPRRELSSQQALIDSVEERHPFDRYASSSSEKNISDNGTATSQINSQVPNLAVQPSQCTIRRTRNLREDGFTTACGVYSPEIAPPVKKQVQKSTAKYHCPRCDSQYTRARTVKDHFSGCIRKYGNPDSLNYNDHPSMPKTAQRGQGLSLANTGSGGDDGMEGEDDEESDIEGESSADEQSYDEEPYEEESGAEGESGAKEQSHSEEQYEEGSVREAGSDMEEQVSGQAQYDVDEPEIATPSWAGEQFGVGNGPAALHPLAMTRSECDLFRATPSATGDQDEHDSLGLTSSVFGQQYHSPTPDFTTVDNPEMRMDFLARGISPPRADNRELSVHIGGGLSDYMDRRSDYSMEHEDTNMGGDTPTG